MKVAFQTLGCKVNLYETEALRQLYEDLHYDVVDFDQFADCYVINTCSVTAVADKKSRQMIHRARKQNPKARIVVTGCYVQNMSEEEKASLGADQILDNEGKRKLLATVRLREMKTRTRADIKIEDGCDQYCSYCIIPYRRGHVKSRSSQEILEEVKSLAKAGHREVVLTGINTSAFGTDTGESLADLIEGIACAKGIERIRLSSLEPRVITEEFLKVLRRTPKFCPHFHLSLQSGCDRTLKAMNRHYTTSEYREKAAMIREAFEHPALTTDIIVGFPGETREDFDQSRVFADEMAFFHMHIFPYSKRSGTRAASMADQVSRQTKQRRVDLMEEVDRKNSAAFAGYYLGKTVRILPEEQETLDGSLYLTGHTDTYVRAMLPLTEEPDFEMQTGIVTKILPDNTLICDRIVQ